MVHQGKIHTFHTIATNFGQSMDLESGLDHIQWANESSRNCTYPIEDPNSTRLIQQRPDFTVSNIQEHDRKEKNQRSETTSGSTGSGVTEEASGGRAMGLGRHRGNSSGRQVERGGGSDQELGFPLSRGAWRISRVAWARRKLLGGCNRVDRDPCDRGASKTN